MRKKPNFAAIEKGKQALLDQWSCGDAGNGVKIRHHVVGDPISFHLTDLRDQVIVCLTIGNARLGNVSLRLSLIHI